MTTVISLIAHKGGVGKTFATVGIAEALATENFRVLVVDADPQANASRRLGLPSDELMSGMVEMMNMAQGPVIPGSAQKYITACRWTTPAAQRISILPSRFDLSTREEDAARPGAVTRVKMALDSAQIRLDYDVILIDTPPSLGHLTQNALVASDLAILVTAPEHDAVQGAVKSGEFIELWKNALGNPTLGITGVVVNGVRKGTKNHSDYLKALEKHFGPAMMWEPRLPLRTELADAMSRAMPLSVSAPVMWPDVQRLARNLMKGYENG